MAMKVKIYAGYSSKAPHGKGKNGQKNAKKKDAQKKARVEVHHEPRPAFDLKGRCDIRVYPHPCPICGKGRAAWVLHKDSLNMFVKECPVCRIPQGVLPISDTVEAYECLRQSYPRMKMEDELALGKRVVALLRKAMAENEKVVRIRL
jgi:hypothetical protein